MSVVEFSWLNAFVGGTFIGFAAVAMMVTIGKIAGISGIFSEILKQGSILSWQWAFIGGLLLSGFVVHWLYQPIPIEIESHTPMLILAGLMVGFGTRLGSGCTTGHGICGVSLFSPRSLTSTAVFTGVGILTVFLVSIF